MDLVIDKTIVNIRKSANLLSEYFPFRTGVFAFYPGDIKVPLLSCVYICHRSKDNALQIPLYRSE